MIRIFSKTDRDFSSNGDIVLLPVKAKVKRDDSNFYLNIEASLTYADWIITGNIIVAPTPQGFQAFRISNPTKTGSKITARCDHIFFDTKNYLIADAYVVDKTTANALSHLNNATEPESPFTTYSDVQHVDSYRCVRTSLYEAVRHVQELWGGKLYINNWNFALLQEIGQDNGITVRYRKNLKEISVTENWDSVVTKILPVGKDGILLNDMNESISIYIVSDTQYGIPYTKSVTFEQDLNQEDYLTPSGEPDEYAYRLALVNDLRNQATEYLKINSVPQVNYTLKAIVDKIVDIGDVIEVIDERLNVDIMTNVISYEYDCLLNKITELEFGNYRPTLAGFNDHITAHVNTTVQQATNEIYTTMSDSFVVYDGTDILVLDRLPKSTALNVIKIGGSGGVSVSHDGINGDFTEIITLDGTIGYEGKAEITENGLSTAFDGDVITLNDIIAFGYYETDVSFSVALPVMVTGGLDPEVVTLLVNVKNMDGTYNIPYNADGNDILSSVDSAVLHGNILTVNLTGLSGICCIYIKTIEVRLTGGGG